MKGYIIFIALLVLSYGTKSQDIVNDLINKLEEEKNTLKEIEDELIKNDNPEYIEENDPEIEKELDEEAESKREVNDIEYWPNGEPIDEFAVNSGEFIRGQRVGDHITHGDIMMTNEEENGVYQSNEEGSKLRDDVYNDGLLDTRKRWPNPVPYKIASSLGSASSTARRTLAAGIAEIEAKTCIRFRNLGSSSTNQYLYIYRGSGCWSYVGRTTMRMQRVSLGTGCHWKTTAMHELIHALGFYHEQSRPDRDNHVRIRTENIRTGMAHNFNKQSARNVGFFGVAYDIRSVMHYSKYAFSKNRRPTIESRANPSATLGQSHLTGGLTATDVAQLNNMYCQGVVTTAPPPPVTTQPPPPVTTQPPSPGTTQPPAPGSMLSRIIAGLDAMKAYFIKELENQ